MSVFKCETIVILDHAKSEHRMHYIRAQIYVTGTIIKETFPPVTQTVVAIAPIDAIVLNSYSKGFVVHRFTVYLTITQFFGEGEVNIGEHSREEVEVNIKPLMRRSQGEH